jgi:radical SAM protein
VRLRLPALPRHAQHRRHPDELTTPEGYALIDRLAAFGSPILVFTGGDPMMRKDLDDLIRYADRAGLRCSLTPTATALPTVERLHRVRQAGIRRVALSLDSPSPEVHDTFRGARGSWDRTLTILANAHKVGLSTQINTTVTRRTVDLLPRMADFVARSGAVQWSVFFLVPTGRAQREDMLTADQHEHTLSWLHELSTSVPFDVKATAAPMYRRIAQQRTAPDHRDPTDATGSLTGARGAGFAFGDGLNRPAQGVNDGRGFLFISHLGDVMPSGLLPLPCGNVRTHDVVEIYRHHPVFTGLRDPERLTGRCGACEFRTVCGGQRGRAYALTGDIYASDPACAYQPSDNQASDDLARRDEAP